MFVGIGDNDNFNICSIAGEFASGDSIQIFDADGNVEVTLTWKSRKGNTGWHDAGNNYLTEYNVARGKSVWFYTKNAISVNQAGQVYGKEITVRFATEFNQTGNPTPVDFKLGEIGFSGMTSGDTIQIFNSNGDVETTYTYKSRKGYTGWHDAANNVATNEVIKAGQAFWTYIKGSEAAMTIPAVIK